MTHLMKLEQAEFSQSDHTAIQTLRVVEVRLNAGHVDNRRLCPDNAASVIIVRFTGRNRNTNRVQTYYSDRT